MGTPIVSRVPLMVCEGGVVSGPKVLKRLETRLKAA